MFPYREISGTERERPTMLGDDILKGIKAITAYLGPQFTNKGVYYLAERGAIPVFRLPPSATIYARKSELDRHFSSTAQPAPQASAA